MRQIDVALVDDDGGGGAPDWVPDDAVIHIDFLGALQGVPIIRFASDSWLTRGAALTAANSSTGFFSVWLQNLGSTPLCISSPSECLKFQSQR